MFVAAFAALLPFLPAALGETYPLAENFQGQSFLDGWDFPASTYDNTTNGDVFWATAQNKSLIYTNDAGRVILKVDNESFVPWNDKRYAFRLTTKRAYPTGTVWLMDAVHMPYGCSVWPALWTHGANWPEGGEIDIMEGIHNQATNQIALHTEQAGCDSSPDVQMLGTLGQTNCSVAYDYATGCTVKDKNDDSYGSAFAAAGGGVYVAEFADAYIKIWFITRSNVPASLTANATSIDTTTLGEPTAYYPASTCNISQYFLPQTLTITTTLCGDWAKEADTFVNNGCPALATNETCYTTYVINNGSETYKNAYFEINYISIFSNGTATENDSGDDAQASGSGTTSDSSGATTTTATVSAASATSGAGRHLVWWSPVVATIAAAGISIIL